MVALWILIATTVILLVTQWVRVEVTALFVVAALGLCKFLRPEEALSGFSNPATLTVAAMLVLSASLERAGVVDYIGVRLARRAAGRTNRLLWWLALPTVLFSAFMNNTAIVALMIPVALTVSRRTKVPASKLLLPISYFSILGGTCTLIGTSTNILVDSLYRSAGGVGFTMFEFTGLGLIYLAVGGTYVVFAAPRHLPARRALSELVDERSTGQFVTEVIVPERSRWIGMSLADVFGDQEELRVLELIRDEDARLGPDPGTLLVAHDALLIEGTARALHELLSSKRVIHGTVVSDEERVPMHRLDLHIVEAVVAPNSRFLHRRVRELGLSRRQGIQVLGVRRLGRHHQYELREFQLHAGDVLLLQGERHALRGLHEDGEILLIEGVGRSLTFPSKAPLAAAILLAVVMLAAFDVAPIVLLAFAGVLVTLLTGCLTIPDALRALDSSVLLLLAGMIPLGLAMERTGLAASLAAGVVEFAGPHEPIFLIASFYLLTSLLTEVLSNNAAAVLLTPICLSVAAGAGIDPKPLLIAVMFGASASFATPIGYQTNTMVMGPGGYKFRDYLRMGVPLNVLTFLVATICIPWFWPVR